MNTQKITNATIHTLAKNYLGTYYNKKKITAQIKRLTNSMSLEEIASTLDYWYRIRQEDPSKSKGGIGIVEYVKEDAEKYWKHLEEVNKANIQINAYNQPKERSFEIKRPIFSKPKTLNLFNLQ